MEPTFGGLMTVSRVLSSGPQFSRRFPSQSRLVGLAAIAVFGLVAAPTASAAPPKPKQALVVPFQSIGKIKLGITRSKAFAAWGSTNLCGIGTGGRETCDWLSTAPADFPEEGGVLELKGGKVCGMLMRAGTDVIHDRLTITQLKRWKTKEGVGLGSSLKAAKHLLGGKLVATRHHVSTAILGGTTPSTSKKVEEITIFKQGCQVVAGAGDPIMQLPARPSPRCAPALNRCPDLGRRCGRGLRGVRPGRDVRSQDYAPWSGADRARRALPLQRRRGTGGSSLG
jgi:hypothetical protein